MTSRYQLGVLVFFIFLVGLMLRTYRLDFQSLWNDEINTWEVSRNQPLKIITNPPRDANIPPLYYLVVHFFLKLERIINQDLLLRLPSVIFSALSILLFYTVTRQWLEKTSSVIATIMMAISPFHIWYAQEARAYALLLFLSLVSVWSLQRLITGKKSIWIKLIFVLFTSLTFYCHTIAIAFIGFIGIYILIVVNHKELKEWIITFGGIVLFIAPAIYRLMIIHPSTSASHLNSFNPLFVVYTIWTFCTGYSIGPTLYELHTPGRDLSSYYPIILSILLFISALLLFGAFHLWKKNRLIFGGGLAWFLCPLVFALLGAIVTVHPFNVRYAILAFPPFIVLLAVGIQSLGVNWMRISAFGMIVMVSLVALANYFFDERYHRDNNRAAGQVLSENALPNDLVIVNAAYTESNLRYYYSGAPVNVRAYPQKADFEVDQDDNLYSGSTGVLFVKLSRFESDIQEIVADQERIWLFLSRAYHSDPNGYIRKFLDQTYHRGFHASWVDTELILYHKIHSSGDVLN